MTQPPTLTRDNPSSSDAKGRSGSGSDRSAEQDKRTAARLGDAFAHGRLSEDERLAAIQTFRRLACDAEVEVRLSLVEHIKGCPFLPHSIARMLADDIEAVAVPILKYSIVLTDEDLVSIIGDGNTVKQQAIAQRSTVSELVSGALVDTGKKAVVDTLLANEGARISDDSLQTVVDVFGGEPEVQALLVDRPALPVAVKEQLVNLVSEDLQKRLIEKHGLPEILVGKMTSHGRERALVQSLETATSNYEIEAAAMRLCLKGALTPTLLLRTLCVGRLDLFAICIATLARIPSAKTRAALADTRSTDFHSLIERSHIPAHLTDAFRVALDVVFDVRCHRAIGWEKADEKRIIQRLVHVYDRLSPDTLESVLYQLGSLEAEA